MAKHVHIHVHDARYDDPADRRKDREYREQLANYTVKVYRKPNAPGWYWTFWGGGSAERGPFKTPEAAQRHAENQGAKKVKILGG